MSFEVCQKCNARSTAGPGLRFCTDCGPSKEENIAAISYSMAVFTDQDDLTFYELHSEELGGQIACFQYFIDCASQFTIAEDRFDSEELGWYEAIDDFVDSILSVDHIPTRQELLDIAVTSLSLHYQKGLSKK